VKKIVHNLDNANAPVLNVLWELEEATLHNHHRMLTFFLSSLRSPIEEFTRAKLNKERGRANVTKVIIDDTKLQFLTSSPLLPHAKKYAQILNKLQSFDRSSDVCHEFVADYMLELADFFRPSPDCRVATLLDLAQYHFDCNYLSEAAITRLTAAALVADCLAILKKLPPGVFSDDAHPANSFIEACPSACHEISTDAIVRGMPQIKGWCHGPYFCESGLIHLIQQAAELCKGARLFELSTKIHLLLRPLAEVRHSWALLDRHFQNAAIAWQLLETMGSKNDRGLGTYYKVQFQDGEVYIYRETQLANVWQVMEKLRARGAIVSGGRPVIVSNEGQELVADKQDAGNYYIHVKAVEQYFTPEERKSRMTVFEQNHNVSHFYFDLPYSKTAQMSIEYCWLKRTIFQLPHPIPYLNSRVRIPKENITKLDYSPIEFCCQNLQQQVDKINDAVNRNDMSSLQPLIQGSLIVQVNEGPKKMAEIFLTGAAENQHTMNLRAIFRLFLEANTKAVATHEFFAGRPENIAFRPLQEELDLGLKTLISTLQPFLK
jgi:hypothetical protein